MRDKEKLISKLLIGLIIFNMIFSFNINTSYATAEEQTKLDSGMVELYSNTSVTFRAGETYVISLKAGEGGRGGTGKQTRWHTDQSGGDGYYYTPTSGGSGSSGETNYYQIDVITDKVMNFYKGGIGAPGRGYDDSNIGGSAGSNSLGGNGTSGGIGGGGTGSLHGGSGGGGGAVSIITFGGDSLKRIVADGGNGGNGAATSYTYQEGGYAYNNAGGSGGIGGTLSETLTGVSGITIKVLSASEGSAKVSSPSTPGAIIRKQRKPTTEPIKVSDLMTGEHIVLTNSVNNASTIFQKTANNFEFKYISGKQYYQAGTNNNTYLEWPDFSKYAVSGSGSAPQNTLLMKVKQDLKFVGGDGSALFPYYPEAAGSIVGGGSGGSSNDSYENTETLANSIVSVAKQIEEQLLYQKVQDEKADLAKSTVVVVTDTEAPIIETFMLKNGASVTSNSTPIIELSIYDNISEFSNLKVQFRLSDTGWTTLQAPSYIMTPSLTLGNGMNNLFIRTLDESGNKVEKRISFFKN